MRGESRGLSCGFALSQVGDVRPAKCGEGGFSLLADGGDDFRRGYDPALAAQTQRQTHHPAGVGGAQFHPQRAGTVTIGGSAAGASSVACSTG